MKKQRELIFRMWDTYTKKMVYTEFYMFGEVLTFDMMGMYAMANPSPEHESSLMRTDDFIVTQYTGLVDDAGTMIYEGDIVEVHMPQETKTPHTAEVCITPYGAVIAPHPSHVALDGFPYRHIADYTREHASIMVIGNKWEAEDGKD